MNIAHFPKAIRAERLLLSIALGVGLLAANAAAIADDEVFIEVEAVPIPREAPPVTAAVPGVQAAPRTPSNGIVVAPFVDKTGMFRNPSDREVLGSSLRAAITARPDARLDIVELPSALEPCDQACELTRARENGVRYLVAPEISLFAGAYLVTVELIGTADGRAARILQSDAVPEPSALLGAFKKTAAEVAATLVGLCGNARSVSPSAAAVAPFSTWTGGVTAANSDAFSLSQPRNDDFKKYRRNRNAGVGLFVFGTILSIVGGVFIGLMDIEEAFLIVGLPIAVVGEALFWGGIGMWVKNQVRMNKVARGIPITRSLRLEGLTPIVASSREGAAPGLAANFSF